MQTIPLSSQARPADTAAKLLVKEGLVPCIVYGNNMKNTSIACSAKELTKAYVKAGESTIVELEMGSKKIPVLFHELQYASVSGNITHVDFYAIDMKKEIEARIPVKFEGEAPGVKELGGILITPYDHVIVKCLPTDLPHELPVNMETLTEFGSALTVADIKVPHGVKIEDDLGTVIATFQEPRKEEVAEAVPVEGAEGEVAAGAEGDEAKAEGGEEGKKEEGGKNE